MAQAEPTETLKRTPLTDIHAALGAKGAAVERGDRIALVGVNGGKVPADFGWFTNPKQYQEESGSSSLAEERDLAREKYTKR